MSRTRHMSHYILLDISPVSMISETDIKHCRTPTTKAFDLSPFSTFLWKIHTKECKYHWFNSLSSFSKKGFNATGQQGLSILKKYDFKAGHICKKRLSPGNRDNHRVALCDNNFLYLTSTNQSTVLILQFA